MDLVGSDLRASPDLYPLAFDRDQDNVGFIRLNRARYEQASFLDERIAAAQDQGGWAPFGAVLPGRLPAAGLPPGALAVGTVLSSGVAGALPVPVLATAGASG